MGISTGIGWRVASLLLVYVTPWLGAECIIAPHCHFNHPVNMSNSQCQAFVYSTPVYY